MRSATLLALGYAGVAGAYIAISTTMASAAAADVQTLRQLELLKGGGFVVVTALAVFAAAAFSLRRQAKQAAELAASREALLEADRRAAAGMLAASVAHDLNNALTILHAGLDELASDGREPDVVADMRVGLTQASDLSRRLAQAGKHSGTGEPEPADLVAVAREAVDLVSLHRAVRRCSVEIEAPGRLDVDLYPMLVNQVLCNLVINACEATGPGGRVRVRLQRGTKGGAMIEVHDDGPGIPDEVRAQLFEPFFTTKEHGTGLGLLSVRLCAELHSGHADVRDSVLGGACLRVALAGPLESLEAPAVAAPLTG